MAENLDINVNVNTSQAQRNLDNLTKKLDTVQAAFTRMKAALVGVALGGFITQTFQFADAIQDLSDATNIGTDAILGFSKAVQLSGGDSDKAQQGLLKFVQTIGEAAEGSMKAQNAFDDVGVTLKDLRTLSEQDLLNKVVNGLGQIDDVGKRSVLQMELFGKALRGVSADQLAATFGAATAGSAEYASAIKAAASAQQNFENVISTLKVELLAALKPVSELASGLLEAGSKAKSFISAVFDIGVVIASFFAITKAIQLVVFAFEALIAAPALLMRGVQALTRTWEAFTFQMSKVWQSGAITAETLAGLQKRFHWLGIAINEIGKGLGILGAGFVAFYKMILPTEAQEKLEKFFGDLKDWVTGAQGAGAGRGGNDELTKQLQQQGEEMRKQADAARQVQDAFAKRTKEIQQSSVAFKTQNNEILDGINLEKSFVGKSSDYVEVVRAQEEILKRAADEANKLRQAKALLTKDEQKLAPIYDEQIQKIAATASADAKRIGEALTGLQGLRMVEQGRKQDIENVTKAIEAQIARQQQLGEQMVSANDKLKEVQFAGDQQKRNPLEQQLANIQEEARKAALEAGRAFAATFEGEELTSQQAQELANGLQQIADKYKLIATEQTNQLNISRTWEQGWKTAFDSYMDNATNAAQQAGQVFQSITSNMNSAIDNFVQTGKFSFKDFTRSIIQDLIKIELKAQASKILGAIGGGGGLFGAIGSLFGFANGGTPPLNKPSIVGEQGPELFVPRSAGTVIPNDKLGGGGNQISAPITNNYITNNISAVDAKSVAQLFAENRKTLLGTVEMARKELPYNNR